MHFALHGISGKKCCIVHVADANACCSLQTIDTWDWYVAQKTWNIFVAHRCKYIQENIIICLISTAHLVCVFIVIFVVQLWLNSCLVCKWTSAAFTHIFPVSFCIFRCTNNNWWWMVGWMDACICLVQYFANWIHALHIHVGINSNFFVGNFDGNQRAMSLIVVRIVVVRIIPSYFPCVCPVARRNLLQLNHAALQNEPLHLFCQIYRRESFKCDTHE